MFGLLGLAVLPLGYLLLQMGAGVHTASLPWVLPVLGLHGGIYLIMRGYRGILSLLLSLAALFAAVWGYTNALAPDTLWLIAYCALCNAIAAMLTCQLYQISSRNKPRAFIRLYGECFRVIGFLIVLLLVMHVLGYAFVLSAEQTGSLLLDGMRQSLIATASSPLGPGAMVCMMAYAAGLFYAAHSLCSGAGFASPSMPTETPLSGQF
jgi:hypothetical protein